MLLLDTTTRSLELKLDGAVVTTEPPFVTSWVDVDQTTFEMTASSETNGTTNGSTAVTVVAAPGASKTRKLNYLSVVNVDTAVVVVTVQVNDNGTKRISFKVSLQVGDQLVFISAHGWSVYTTNGAIKATFPGLALF